MLKAIARVEKNPDLSIVIITEPTPKVAHFNEKTKKLNESRIFDVFETDPDVQKRSEIIDEQILFQLFDTGYNYTHKEILEKLNKLYPDTEISFNKSLKIYTLGNLFTYDFP